MGLSSLVARAHRGDTGRLIRSDLSFLSFRRIPGRCPARHFRPIRVEVVEDARVVLLRTYSRLAFHNHVSRQDASNHLEAIH